VSGSAAEFRISGQKAPQTGPHHRVQQRLQGASTMGYRTWLFVLAFTIAVLALTAALSMPAASAAVLTVDTTADDVSKSACDDSVPGDCSLRGAIVRANGLSEASTILVPAGTYSLTTSAPCTFQTHQFGTFSLNTISLCLHGNITLVGASSDTTIIDANKVDRVVAVSDYTVEIRDVTLRNGTTQTAGSFDGVLQGGGGINNGGTLTLVDSVVSGNTAMLDGGGIFNGHTLFIVRSKILGNTSAGGGGGITNESYFEVTALSIQDTTIAQNVATTRDGGGIFNFGGAIAIAGSTISGNQAAGLGGGIENINNSAAIQIVNSTISGNSSGSAGGGIEQHSGTLTLNNVTIANNTSATDQRGEGGGIAMALPVTMSNTVIAGNHDANGGAPDCSGTIASAGYNLIQTTTNLFRGFLVTTCNITGDTTGNIIGQSPLLGSLKDNGGFTFTHAPGAGSPLLDAGRPAGSGSDGNACRALDQRGLPRPFGARCDIGAVERDPTFVLGHVRPASGGRGGFVSAVVQGNGMLQGASVRLAKAGQADIVGSPAQVDVGGSSFAASFDLTSAAPGIWDVVVRNPDATERRLPGAFTVEAQGSVDLWALVTGFVRREGPSKFTVTYGNRGNLDALAVPLLISASGLYGFGTLFDIAQPPAQSGQVLTDFSQVPTTVSAGGTGGYNNLPLLLPIVPAGSSGSLQISLDIPPDAEASTLFVSFDTPLFNPTVAASIVTALANGAIAYAPVGFAVTIPSSLEPAIEAYIRTQLDLAVTRGRQALVSGIGRPIVYSPAQMQIDAALYGARRALQP
jgi:hypothetical protein